MKAIVRPGTAAAGLHQVGVGEDVGPADVDVVRLPDEVGAALAVLLAVDLGCGLAVEGPTPPRCGRSGLLALSTLSRAASSISRPARISAAVVVHRLGDYLPSVDLLVVPQARQAVEALGAAHDHRGHAELGQQREAILDAVRLRLKELLDPRRELRVGVGATVEQS